MVMLFYMLSTCKWTYGLISVCLLFNMFGFNVGGFLVSILQGILINGQFPGPQIDAVTNDNLIISVYNYLREPFLISWYIPFPTRILVFLFI